MEKMELSILFFLHINKQVSSVSPVVISSVRVRRSTCHDKAPPRNSVLDRSRSSYFMYLQFACIFDVTEE